MNRILTPLLLLCLMPFLVQCVATEKELQSVDLRMRTMDNRVVNIDNEVEELRNNIIKEVRTLQAQEGNRIDILQTELMILKEKLEENAHYTRQLREENKELATSLNGRLDILEARLAGAIDSLAANLSELHQQLAQTNERVTAVGSEISRAGEQINRNEKQLASLDAETEAIKATHIREAAERARQAAEQARVAEEEARAKAAATEEPIEIAPEQEKKRIGLSSDAPSAAPIEEKPAEKAAAPPEKNATVTDTSSPVSEMNLYEQGLEKYRQKDYKEARHFFSGYIDKNPAGKMIADARLLLGDSLYNQNDFELAILEYQKIIVDFAHHPTAPAALLKQGMSFEKLADNSTAKIIYQRVLDEYPASTQAEQAKKRLAALK